MSLAETLRELRVTPPHLPQPKRDPVDPPARRTGSQPTRRTDPVPARRPDAGPVPHRPTQRQPSVHEARTLGLVDRPGRDYWWDQLGEKVRDRMVTRVGPIVEWWAYCHRTQTQRPYAVVLGERGLAVATPTVNDRGGPAQLLTVLPFVPSSLRHAIVVQKAGRALSGRPPSPGAADPPTPSTADISMSADLRGFLGNLPVEAQSRLQWPFANGDVLDRGDYHYSGSSDELDIWCYLAGRRWVTFVSGHGTGLSGPAHRASWRLICRRAEVAVR